MFEVVQPAVVPGVGEVDDEDGLGDEVNAAGKPGKFAVSVEKVVGD